MSKLVCVRCGPQTATAETAALCPACLQAGWCSINIDDLARDSGQSPALVLEHLRYTAELGWLELQETIFPDATGRPLWLGVVIRPSDALLHNPAALPTEKPAR